MHVEGFKTALTTVVNKYARAKNLLKEKDENLLGEDIREGITAIVSVKLREPQFEGQTKAKLGNVPMRSFVQKATNERLAEWLEENPTEANKVVKKAHRRGPGPRRRQERPQRDPPQDGAVRRRHARQVEGLLVSSNADESELFIVEGDSAGGTALDARDPRTQAILPIRGKILNVERARIDKMLKNNEIQALITAIGAGVGEEFDVAKARYHKVIALCRRRRRRQPHPHAAAHVLLPPDARHGRGRLRVHRPAAAVLHRGRQGEGVPQGRRRQGAVPGRAPEPQEGVPAPEGPRRDGLGRAASRPRWTPSTRTLLQVTVEEAADGRRDHERADGRRRREPRAKFITTNARDVRNLDF